MTIKKKSTEAEFDIDEPKIEDTSDGNICICSTKNGRDVACVLHGG